MLVDDQDSLFAWWHRGFYWEAGQQTTNALQGVKGSIDPGTGALTLDSPVDLGLPYVDGFGPDYTPDYSGLEMDPDGYLWLVTSPKVTVQQPVVQLLYGDDLLVGTYRYALSYESASSELGCGYYTQKTTLSQASVPGAPSNFSNPNVGTFPAGTHYFKVTFYKSDGTSGNGETTAGNYGAYNLATGSRSIRMAIPRSLANGGRKVYYASSASGPYYLIHTQADYNTDYIEVFNPISSGTEPPTTNTLPAKRTRVWNIDQGPPGTTSRRIYRTQAGGSTYGLVGTVSNNLNDQEWDDDTGDSIGASPPNNPTNHSYRCLAVGRSNASRSWASGVTWQSVFGWYPWDWLGDRCGIVALGSGLAAVVYQNTSSGLSAQRRTTTGTWGDEVNLTSGSLGTITLHGGAAHLCYLKHSGGIPGIDQWYYAPLSVSDDGVTLGSPVPANEGWPYSQAPPGLSWNAEEELLVMHGGAWNYYCHAFNVATGDEVEVAGGDIPVNGLAAFDTTAPHTAAGKILWLLFTDWDENYGIVVSTPIDRDDTCDECEGEEQPTCDSSASEMNSSLVGNQGGPSGGTPSAGMSGYVGGRAQPRLASSAVNLDAVTGLRISDSSGKVALRHSTTASELRFSAARDESGPLGWNWTHDYHVTLTQQSPTLVDIQHESGRCDRYYFDGRVWTP
ncbi:MAG: hypothetical protein ACE149_07615, partial [Armatimonadota bacterium]